MKKKYIVRLTQEERNQLKGIIKKLSGNSQKVKRAWILLKADADGPGWTDQQIADAYMCRTRTIEKIRQRFITEGFEVTLEGKQRENPPRAKILDGHQEAEVIALRLGEPPSGYSNWSLRLLAQRVVELGIVEAVSHETVRQTLKKTASPGARSNTGSSRRRRPTAS